MRICILNMIYDYLWPLNVYDCLILIMIGICFFRPGTWKELEEASGGELCPAIEV